MRLTVAQALVRFLAVQYSERDGERQSLLRYFHGRSSLGTWLRALLAQRQVDRIRQTLRLDSLPADVGRGRILRLQRSRTLDLGVDLRVA